MNEQRNPEPRRPYTLKRRQAGIDETRQRITAAAFELHAMIGPSRTTISAIAERAGVQRHTVYHHFPDLDALYEACTAHGLRVSGVPQPAAWMSIADPAERLRRGLTDLFAWFRANERMLSSILGDAAMSEPAAAEPAAAAAEPAAAAAEPAAAPEPDLFDRHMRSIFATLTDGWMCVEPARPLLEAVIGHAMAFETWRSLTRSGLSDDQVRHFLVNAAAAVARDTLTASPSG